MNRFQEMYFKFNLRRCNKVTTKWGDVEFQCVSYKESKDTFILGGIEAGAYTPPLFGST
jgi:hypothetical protein